jgi:hypothetical protein
MDRNSSTNAPKLKSQANVFYVLPNDELAFQEKQVETLSARVSRKNRSQRSSQSALSGDIIVSAALVGSSDYTVV